MEKTSNKPEKERLSANRKNQENETSGHTLAPPPFQLKADASPPAGGGNNPSGKGLPGQLKSGIENLSGMSMDDVSVKYNSSQPAGMNALAYAQGSEIHLGPGQEKHLPHEAWHVVQQKQGKVQATTSANGVDVNDDAGLEREADQMGDRAMRTGSDPASKPVQKKAQGATQLKSKGGVVQKKDDPETSGGKWKTKRYDEIKKDGKSIGMDAVISFEPNGGVDATKIGLAQALKPTNEGKANPVDDYAKDRMVTEGVGEGWYHDRVKTRNNPIYGSPQIDEKKGLEDTPQDNRWKGEKTEVGTNATYQLGHRYEDEKGTEQKKNAELSDKPTRPSRGKNAGQRFETTAIALEGEQKGSYYGSVEWGWETDEKGDFKAIDFDVVSHGVPSANFMAAADKWNEHQQLGHYLTKAKDTVVYDKKLKELKKLGKDVKITSTKMASAGGVKYVQVKVGGKLGYVKLSDLKEKKIDTLDLPLVDVHVTKSAVGLDDDVAKACHDLPAGTRVKLLDKSQMLCSPEESERSGQVKVEVVDGKTKELVGLSGWIDFEVLKDEDVNVE